MFHSEFDVDWKRFAPGFGIFGEFAPVRFFAFGLEVFMAFPKIDKLEEDTYSLDGSKESLILLSVLLRLKFPIRIGKWVAPYPIIGGGFNMSIIREQTRSDKVNIGGMALAGVGVEFYPHSRITPFLELRYRFAASFRENTFSDSDRKAEYKLFEHGLALALGVRFL